ncbi:Ycf48-like protein [mine drainage metagenome]|uniref:Ycf48-like protein n=1 Tax=mine drainage metagenome TaxID=410659 RepID=A0A1J5RMU8_9ZZZZ
MKSIKTIFIFLLMMFCRNSFSQSIQILQSGTKTSIRGLSVVTDKIIWASGSNGTVAKSTDGGNTWQWLIVKDFGKRDFRDIEAFDSNTAIIMAVAEPGLILKTKDGGKNWYKVFEDSTKGMFLDAMDFDNKGYGIVIGDPINGKLFRANTNNFGESWQKNDWAPDLKEGEAFFAASGTNLKIVVPPQKQDIFVYVSGGKVSALRQGGGYKILPLIQGKESTGANSIDVYNYNAVIVGGDFNNDKDTTLNCVLVNLNNHFSFSHPQTPPHGYRSCVIYISEKQLITCGTSGIDISNDGGLNWKLISTESFHVVQKAKKGNAIFLAGSNGRIAKLIL